MIYQTLRPMAPYLPGLAPNTVGILNVIGDLYFSNQTNYIADFSAGGNDLINCHRDGPTAERHRHPSTR